MFPPVSQVNLVPVLFKLDVDFVCTKFAVRRHRLQRGLQMLELHLEGGIFDEKSYQATQQQQQFEGAPYMLEITTYPRE